MQDIINFVLSNFWSIVFILVLFPKMKTRYYSIVYIAYMITFDFNRYIAGTIAFMAVFLAAGPTKKRIDSEELSRN